MDAANAATAAPAELTGDEKAYAGLSHTLMIVTWWIGPLVIYLMKKDSRFVRFHALQAIYWQIIFGVLYVAIFGTFILAILATIPAQGSHARQPLPIALFAGFGVLWMLVMTAYALNFVLGILFTLKAMRGEWAGYPVIGRWARRAAGI